MSSKEQIEALKEFSACDVSDALLKLETPVSGKPPRGGYLVDLVPYAPSSPFAPSLQPKIIAPASTLRLLDKDASTATFPEGDYRHIPKTSHWADLTEPDTILVVEQPRHQTCAAVGGIMASRMKVRGLVGCVVSGRVRDLTELSNSSLPIWAAGRSTVGQGAEAKVAARNVPITVGDVVVKPGDIVFCDPLDGVVVIPQELVEKVIELMSDLVQADEKVKADVEGGSTVYEAFKKHRK